MTMKTTRLRASMVLAALALSACGGGSSGSSGTGSTTSADATASSEGIWTGSLTSTTTSAKHTVTLVVLQTGELRMVWDNCVQLVATSATASGYYSGNGDAYAPDGSNAACPVSVTFPDASTLASLTVAGQITAGSSLIGSYSAGGDNGSYNLTYSSLYSRAGTLARIAGNYSNGTMALTIDSSGNVTGSIGSATTITGAVTTIDTSKNAYRIVLNETTTSTSSTTTTTSGTTSGTTSTTTTTTGATSTSTLVTLSGLATLIDYSSGTDNYLVLSVSNTTSGVALPLIRQ